MFIKKKLKYFTRPKQISPDLSGVSGDFRIVWRMQEDDTGIGPILRLLESRGADQKPPIEAVSHLDPECKFWHGRWELLEIHNGVMCEKWLGKDQVRLRICAPSVLRDVVLWHP